MSCNTLVIYSEMAVWQLEVRPNKLFSFTQSPTSLRALVRLACKTRPARPLINTCYSKKVT